MSERRGANRYNLHHITPPCTNWHNSQNFNELLDEPRNKLNSTSTPSENLSHGTQTSLNVETQMENGTIQSHGFI